MFHQLPLNLLIAHQVARRLYVGETNILSAAGSVAGRAESRTPQEVSE